jgi:predicted secreted hydrolase
VARTNRGALDLAGAQGEPYRVWNGSWSAEGWAPTRLRAAAGEAAGRFAIDLELQPGKPPVLQGDHGLSRKGPEPGNASYYYSLTRMPTAGTVRVGDTTFAVTGLAWMDREWSTSALSPEVVGWDWFALPLDDGSEVMLYRLRRRDGTTSPFSAGTLVDADGAGHPLSATEFAVAATSAWTSPRSGVRYASGWTVTVPGEGLELRVAPLLADQELDVGFRYWEGACSISGTRHGRTVAGRGYAELTGYDEAAAPVIGTGAGSGAMR